MGCRILSFPGGAVGVAPDSRRGGRGGTAGPAGPGRGSAPLSPAVSAKPGGGAGPDRRSAQSQRARGQATAAWGPGGAGHLPSSSTFFPAGSLERERVETSLRMQDLTGSKTHAETGPGPGVGGREGCGLGAPGRALPRTGGQPGAELRRARVPRRPWAGRASRDLGRGGFVTKGSARHRRRLQRLRHCPTLVRWPRVRLRKPRLIPAGRNRRSRLAPRPPSLSGIPRIWAKLNERSDGCGAGNPDMGRPALGVGRDLWGPTELASEDGVRVRCRLAGAEECACASGPGSPGDVAVHLSSAVEKLLAALPAALGFSGAGGCVPGGPCSLPLFSGVREPRSPRGIHDASLLSRPHSGSAPAPALPLRREGSGPLGSECCCGPAFWAFFAFSGGDVFLKLWFHVKNSFPQHLSSLVTKTVLAGVGGRLLSRSRCFVGHAPPDI